MKLAVKAKFTSLLLTGLLPATAFCNTEAAPAAPTATASAQAAVQEVAKPREYPGKISGDNAFQEQNFADAARFYRTYQEEAKVYKDEPAILDAYECELNALIMAADVAHAEKVLKTYEKIAPKDSALSIEFWKIDLMLLKGQTAQAEKALTALLAKITKQDPRRTRAELMLAAAYDLQGKYDQASAIYATLYKQPAPADFNRRIAERLIFSLTAAGKNEQAFEVLTALNADSTERNNEAHHFLNIYLALKGSVANSTGLKFEKTNVIRTSRQDDFFYLITSLIGDEFTQKKEYQSALNAYKLAYLYARNRKEIIATLTRMTVMLDKMKEKKAAAELALTLQDVFHHSTTDLKTRRFVARLFFDAGKTEEALEHYRFIFSKDHTKPTATINYLVRQKQYDHAEQLIKLYYKDTPDCAEAFATLAALASAKGEPENAALLYIKAYEKGDMNAASRAIRIYSDLKQYSALIDFTSRIIREKGDNAEAYYFQAKAKETLGKLDEARTDFLFCERNGSFLPAQALFNAAAIAYRQNDYKQAKNDFKRLFETNSPAYQALAPEAAYWQALCAYNMDQTTNLEKISAALQKKFPDSRFTAMTMLLLTEVYTKSGQAGKAEKLLEQSSAMKAIPEIQADALYKQAVLAYRKKNHTQAEELLLKIRTDYAEVAPLADNYYLLGDICRAQSKFAEAAAAYAEAAKRRPGSRLAQAAIGSQGDSIFALAAANDSQDRFKEAKEIYEKLLAEQDILPEYRIMTYYKVARCIQLMGDTNTAFEQYRMMFSSIPHRNAAASPVIKFWLVKGMDALELIALKNTSIEKIDDVIRAMDSLNRSGITAKQNYPKRIQRLNNYKLQLINSGEPQK